MWKLWAALVLVSQFMHFAFIDASDYAYSTALYFGDDLALCAISLFAFSICPWCRIAPKMAAFAFVWWSTMCLLGNAALEHIEYFDTTGPYEAAAMFIMTGALIAFGSMRFLLFKSPEICIVSDDHLYLIVSSPRTITGIIAAILTGKGGGFTVWHPGSCALFKYLRVGKRSLFTKAHQTDCPKSKIVIDIGPTTKARLDYLDSQLGSQWSWFSNCLTKMGALRYDW